MGRKNKLKKFNDLLSYGNVLENFERDKNILVVNEEEEANPKGQWSKFQFDNENEIVLEMACGKGDYTLELARRYPETNFIGVDIKGNRIWKGAKIALEEGLKNVAFLRTRIEFIADFFGENEVSEIWITFPDPFPRKSKVNRRLTSPMFLDIFRSFLKPPGIVRLKTDADSLYEFTLDVANENEDVNLIHANSDIYADVLQNPDLDIKTFYEHQHLEAGKKIKFVELHVLNKNSEQARSG